MKLRISNIPSESMDIINISYKEFKEQSIYPWIITQNWESIIIHGDINIPLGIIPQLFYGKTIELKVTEDFIELPKAMKLLCEIFPDNSPKLRATFMSDRESYKDLVNSLVKEGDIDCIDYGTIMEED